MIYFLLVYVIFKMFLVLTIYQQSHYEIKAYIKHFICNVLYYDLFVLLALTLSKITNSLYIDIICGIYIVSYSVLYLIVRKRVVITKRIIILMLITLSLLSGYYFIPYINEYLFLLIEFSIIPFLFLDKVINKILNYPNIKKAKIKLEAYQGKRIIITGSYGKTSTKVLFNQILSNFYNVTKTPKSYNTELGITKFINETNIHLYDYLILEYGASKVKDIDKLLRLSIPNVAVITDIGLMHLSTFKTIDNIIDEKMKLALSSSIVILNYDNQYIRNYKLVNNPKVLSYGFDYGDYQARNLIDNSFDLYYKDIFIEHFDINLSGKHHISNLLAVLAYCHYIKLDLKVISRIANNLEIEKNRLDIKRIGNKTIIDDSFNSNLKGFKEALSVLRVSKDKRILITPGIVELSSYKSIVNQELAVDIKVSCDIVILVGYDETKDLYNKLKEYSLEIYLVKDFFEGYSLYKSISSYYIKTTLLIENDLPDLYRRRLLL